MRHREGVRLANRRINCTWSGRSTFSTSSKNTRPGRTQVNSACRAEIRTPWMGAVLKSPNRKISKSFNNYSGSGRGASRANDFVTKRRSGFGAGQKRMLPAARQNVGSNPQPPCQCRSHGLSLSKLSPAAAGAVRTFASIVEKGPRPPRRAFATFVKEETERTAIPAKEPTFAEGASRQHRCQRASRRDSPRPLRPGTDIALTILFPLKNLLRHTWSRRWFRMYRREFPLLADARTQSFHKAFPSPSGSS